ncbi:MAG TPA: CPBP family glutamic-type intramembrane protease [Candidatus Saccharimonadia bacterium]
MQSLRQLYRQFRSGWLSVTLFYALLLGLVFGLYVWATRHLGVTLPPAARALPIVVAPERLWVGLNAVWLIFAWGFTLQLLLGLVWIWRRHPKDGNLGFLLRRGVWLSAHAGIFEELIFRYYGYFALVLGLVALDRWTAGRLAQAVAAWVNPLVNVVTLGQFADQFNAASWPLGLAAIIGAWFFRNAHVHYGPLAKANVWVIGVIMFWLMLHYGLVTAMAAHMLYDVAVFLAVALISPLQPRH